MLAVHRRRPGVQEEEISCAVGVLRFPGRQTRLTEGGGLLVTEDAGHGNPREWATLACVPVHLRRTTDLRQHRHRNTEVLTDLRIPLQGLEIHQHRARRVGHVRDVDTRRVAVLSAAAGEVPQDPGVDRAECEVGPPRPSPAPRRHCRGSTGPSARRSRWTVAAPWWPDTARVRRLLPVAPPADRSGCPATRSRCTPALRWCDPTRSWSHVGW